ncbi:MAG TPA: FoF1 ATP synthase subunit gamma [Pirellulales bacterium]|nr:FoF1 ATP synthase subunit gamma [Pirellulales bacterium]
MTLEQTQRRRQAVSTIHDIVAAMRAIAAGRIQRAGRALEAGRRYEDVVRRGIAAVAAQSSADSLPLVNGRPPLLIVLTSEQPLCGAFNHAVLALAERRWQAMNREGAQLVVVGQRGLRVLARRGITPHVAESGATTLQAVRDVVKRLAKMIDRRYASRSLGPLHIIYNRYQSVSEQLPTEERLLPLDLSQFRRQAPRANPVRRYLPVEDLMAGLVGEYAFISLYRMAADSYASEQASRLVAMDGATRSTDRMVRSLVDLERRERQQEVTRQVLELIAARFAATDDEVVSDFPESFSVTGTTEETRVQPVATSAAELF